MSEYDGADMALSSISSSQDTFDYVIDVGSVVCVLAHRLSPEHLIPEHLIKEDAS